MENNVMKKSPKIGRKINKDSENMSLIINEKDL